MVTPVYSHYVQYWSKIIVMGDYFTEDLLDTWILQNVLHKTYKIQMSDGLLARTFTNTLNMAIQLICRNYTYCHTLGT